jgi:Secretion system C-terminal sorting domain
MKKILLSLFIMAVIGYTAKVQAQCNGASVTISNLTVNPTTTTVSYSFNWQYVQGNASIQVQYLCNGVLVASDACLPFLKDSTAGIHTRTGSRTITCIGNLRVQVVIWTNNSCGGTNCVAAFRDISQSTLPANYKSFSATRNQSNVLLKWETLWEQNSRGFSIERNTKGVWEEIVFVPSQAQGGNSGDLLTYQYIDANNVKGISQYRIRQVDFDDKSKYSEIRSVRGENQISNIIVYPNPSFDGKVNVSFADASVIRDISLIDMNGRIINQWKSFTTNQLSIGNLTPGLYSLRVVIPETGEQIVEKIVVNKR